MADQVHEFGGFEQSGQSHGKESQALVGFDEDLAIDIGLQDHFHARCIDHFVQGLNFVLMVEGEIGKILQRRARFMKSADGGERVKSSTINLEPVRPVDKTKTGA